MAARAPSVPHTTTPSGHARRRHRAGAMRGMETPARARRWRGDAGCRRPPRHRRHGPASPADNAGRSRTRLVEERDGDGHERVRQRRKQAGVHAAHELGRAGRGFFVLLGRHLRGRFGLCGLAGEGAAAGQLGRHAGGVTGRWRGRRLRGRLHGAFPTAGGERGAGGGPRTGHPGGRARGARTRVAGEVGRSARGETGALSSWRPGKVRNTGSGGASFWGRQKGVGRGHPSQSQRRAGGALPAHRAVC